MDNNFETIVQAWRDRSDWTAPNNLLSMSGDPPDTPAFRPKEDDHERSAAGVAPPGPAPAPPAPLVAAAAVAAAPPKDATHPDDTTTDENTNLIFHKYDDDQDKDGAGDAKGKEDDYLENKDDEDTPKGPDSKSKSEKDKMDGVYVKRPPAHKARSAASSQDDEGCGMKCLYFTMQCCDCSIM